MLQLNRFIVLPRDKPIHLSAISLFSTYDSFSIFVHCSIFNNWFPDTGPTTWLREYGIESIEFMPIFSSLSFFITNTQSIHQSNKCMLVVVSIDFWLTVPFFVVPVWFSIPSARFTRPFLVMMLILHRDQINLLR